MRLDYSRLAVECSAREDSNQHKTHTTNTIADFLHQTVAIADVLVEGAREWGSVERSETQ